MLSSNWGKGMRGFVRSVICCVIEEEAARSKAENEYDYLILHSQGTEKFGLRSLEQRTVSSADFEVVRLR